MGVSILVGGLTTLLGVVPLAISTLDIFGTVFKAFFGMIALGTTHGLILLPVILSIVGPTAFVRGHAVIEGNTDKREDDKNILRTDTEESRETSLCTGDSFDRISGGSPDDISV